MAAKPDSGIQDGNKQSENLKRFHFKSRSDDDVFAKDHSRVHKRRRHNDPSHRHRKRRGSLKEGEDIRGPHDDSTNSLPPDQAFRESLFDAMGDDEGAAFWENVYGQPIHNYSNMYQDQETGKLEQMNDEEYATFVRRKMWEKSWEGIEAAREENRKEREREKQRLYEEGQTQDEQRRTAHYYDVFDAQIGASLRRGERRKDGKRWRDLWDDYLRHWQDLQEVAQTHQTAGADREQLFLRNKIAWPVETGKRQDVTREEIENFVRKGTANVEGTAGTDHFMNAIKSERVRWHPDKIQQRFGFMKVDEDTLKAVTAVFQVFDAIWNETRQRAA